MEVGQEDEGKGEKSGEVAVMQIKDVVFLVVVLLLPFAFVTVRFPAYSVKVRHRQEAGGRRQEKERLLAV